MRAYRTVSFAGATLLAGLPPWELVARRHAETFRRTRELRRSPEEGLDPWRLRAVRAIADAGMFGEWKRWAADPNLGGARMREAIRSHLAEWVNRGWGNLSFRLVQVMTGHGCFGQFLHRIGRDEAPRCRHCRARDDTAQHTLGECPAWAGERETLRRTVGDNLDLPTVVARMVKGRGAWLAMARYCERVMLQKEQAERERRGEAPGGVPRHRRRRRGHAGEGRTRDGGG